MTFLVEDPINLRYFTGLELSAGVLLEGERLFVDGRYLEVAKERSPVPVELFSWEKLQYLTHVEVDTTTITAHRLEVLKEKLPCEITALPFACQRKRMIKKPEEIVALRKAADLGSLGFDDACNRLEEGISEKEVAKQLEIFWLNQGADGVAFSPIVAFGEHSALPHHRCSERKLKKGDTVLLDLGVKLNGYASDMTRVLFFGEPDQRILEIYSVVLEAFEKSKAALRPGMACLAVDEVARAHIAAAGYEFVHSLGHGVGLEVHEAPVLSKREPWADVALQEGMVITVEPGIYLPQVGGVRLEDTFLITQGECESLTCRPLPPLQL
ncbi:MAG: aminopeptidase P family protein [Verrucomicrobia bacterium]|nr:aminopeptidase P family protein [Verrucomicrobiota bacterium]